MQKFGLMGNPLGHSMSEFIHNALFKISEMQAEYVMMDFPPDQLADKVRWAGEHLQGFNCTIPYKRSVMQYLDEIDERAAFYGAVNTVCNTDGKLKGYNTDWQGFNRSLAKANITLRGKNVLVLGAGGVSRIMAFEAVLGEAGKVMIHSRTDHNSQKLVSELNQNTGGDKAEIYGGQRADIILNGTPQGMWPKTGELPLSKETIKTAEGIFDTIYNPIKTSLLLYAEEQGIVNENGLSMLVLQAAEAQRIWGTGDFSETELNGIISDAGKEICRLFPVNIVLTGFMGSGKSTVGKLLADRLNYRFVDIDEKIAEYEGKTIPQIFETKGEAYFRKIETKMIQQAVGERAQVIATGGGAIMDDVNEKIIRQNSCFIIYLEADPDNILKRISDCKDRPLIQGEDLAEKTMKLYDSRLERYRASCSVKIDANKSETHIIKQIIKLLYKEE